MRLEVVRGDLTAQDVDAIVNAANSSLLGGGGVDGAIHAAAGPTLLEHCRAVRREAWPDGLPTGEAVVTPGGRLPARFVIHTVGPVHSQHPDGGVALLARCHHSSLEQAEAVGARSVAFPAISCGAYGWSVEKAAPIAVAAVREHSRRQAESSISLVRFVLVDEHALDAFATAVGSVE